MSTANRLSLDMMLPKIQPKARLKAIDLFRVCNHIISVYFGGDLHNIIIYE